MHRTAAANFATPWSRSIKTDGQSRRRVVASSVEYGSTRSSSRLAWQVRVFLATIFLPWTISLGSLQLTPYRIALLFLSVPVLVRYISGAAGRITLPDICVVMFATWAALGILLHHGLALAVQPGGILFIETLLPFLLARTYIKSGEHFLEMVKFLFLIVMCLLPFVLIESIAGVNMILRGASTVFPSFVEMHDERWGLRRAQGPFEHPILYGVVTANIWALVHVVLGHGKPASQRFLLSGLVAIAAFLSLSAGPISALLWQVMLLSWDRIFKAVAARWALLICLLACAYVAISLGSNQSVFEFLITHFSFDEGNAYYRFLIWHFGTISAALHPLFGVGLDNWERPDWMPPSIDMFWLFNAIRYGIPAAVFIALATMFSIARVAKAQITDSFLADCRLAYIASLIGFFVVGWTVHFWNGTFVMFMFILGSGFFLATNRLADSDCIGRAMSKRRI